jgi:hypothetical protein
MVLPERVAQRRLDESKQLLIALGITGIGGCINRLPDNADATFGVSHWVTSSSDLSRQRQQLQPHLAVAIRSCSSQRSLSASRSVLASTVPGTIRRRRPLRTRSTFQHQHALSSGVAVSKVKQATRLSPHTRHLNMLTLPASG